MMLALYSLAFFGGGASEPVLYHCFGLLRFNYMVYINITQYFFIHNILLQLTSCIMRSETPLIARSRGLGTSPSVGGAVHSRRVYPAPK